jgi:hypothetical protein
MQPSSDSVSPGEICKSLTANAAVGLAYICSSYVVAAFATLRELYFYEPATTRGRLVFCFQPTPRPVATVVNSSSASHCADFASIRVLSRV